MRDSAWQLWKPCQQDCFRWWAIFQRFVDWSHALALACSSIFRTWKQLPINSSENGETSNPIICAIVDNPSTPLQSSIGGRFLKNTWNYMNIFVVQRRGTFWVSRFLSVRQQRR